MHTDALLFFGTWVFLLAASYAVLFNAARQRGRMLPTNDLWIAATALAHDLTLVTADRHFTELPVECLLLE